MIKLAASEPPSRSKSSSSNASSVYFLGFFLSLGLNGLRGCIYMAIIYFTASGDVIVGCGVAFLLLRLDFLVRGELGIPSILPFVN
jgi:hypothetical protein